MEVREPVRKAENGVRERCVGRGRGKRKDRVEGSREHITVQGFAVVLVKSHDFLWHPLPRSHNHTPHRPQRSALLSLHLPAGAI